MNATYTIESGIDIPEPKLGRYAHARYPFHKMKVGDSFLIPQNGGGKQALEKERTLALTTARQFKIKVVSRVVLGGIRVWKVAQLNQRRPVCVPDAMADSLPNP